MFKNATGETLGSIPLRVPLTLGVDRSDGLLNLRPSPSSSRLSCVFLRTHGIVHPATPRNRSPRRDSSCCAPVLCPRLSRQPIVHRTRFARFPCAAARDVE